jgi:regulator of sirC expression with transglutaminase-like and TPR domain
MENFRFQDELRQAPVNLPRAALRFAREIAYRSLDLYRYLARLDHLARSARNFMDPDAPVHTQTDSLADFLFRQLGFAGNTSDYNDPRNNYLNEVIDRRLGNPISLSVLMIVVARRLGILASGIGLPGHFIVGVYGLDKWYFYDPFHGGMRISQNDCAQLVFSSTGYSGPFQPEWLQPVNASQVLARMLNNLRLAYIQREEWRPARAVIERLRLLQPDKHELLRDLGFVYHQQGSLHKAVYFYEQYLHRAQPPDEEAETITRALRTAAYQLARRN